MVENCDIRIGAGAVQHDALNLFAGNVPGVENAPFMVSALAPQVEFIDVIGFANFAAGSEVSAAFHQFRNGLRAAFDDFSNGDFVAKPSAGVEGVKNVFIKTVTLGGDAGNAALSTFGAADVWRKFRKNGNLFSGFG